jgi:hypothetical protein
MTFAVLDKGKCPTAAAGVTKFPSVCVRLGGEVRHHELSLCAAITRFHATKSK